MTKHDVFSLSGDCTCKQEVKRSPKVCVGPVLNLGEASEKHFYIIPCAPKKRAFLHHIDVVTNASQLQLSDCYDQEKFNVVTAK